MHFMVSVSGIRGRDKIKNDDIRIKLRVSSFNSTVNKYIESRYKSKKK
jgi:hypothetical protein